MSHDRVSIHGGHSGDYCLHARDTLEEIIQAYIRQGFSWVGITEHMPPVTDDFLYPDEISAGLSKIILTDRFDDYFKTLDLLKLKYSEQITILKAFETETCGDYIPEVKTLRDSLTPDYIVGSVHHVHDLCFDYSDHYYLKALEKSGSLENLYHDYFDAQYTMIRELKPEVIGHFDLIRIYDPDYKKTLARKEIQDKIVRYLSLIQKEDLVLDFNTRALFKQAAEPYISDSLLELIKKMDIRILPGDDSHSAEQAGMFVDNALEILREKGISIDLKLASFIKNRSV